MGTRYYDIMEESNSNLKHHVDDMYNLINEYAKEHHIKLAYDDTAEVFVEAIATYIVVSGSSSKKGDK